MPRRKSRRRTSRKTRSSSRRRISFGRPRAVKTPFGRRMGITPVGMPHTQFVKLKYNEVLYANGISAGGGGTAQVSYKANSLYDPQNATNMSTATGHVNNGQPLYRDQWASFYYQYRVYATKFKITWTPTNQDNTDLPVTGIYMPSPYTMVAYGSDAVSSDSDLCITKDRIGCKYIDSGGTGYTVNKGNISIYQVHNKSLGLTKRQYSDDKTTAGGMSTGSNPSTVSYMNIMVQNWDSTSYMYGYLTVSFKFYCKLFDPVENVAQS